MYSFPPKAWDLHGLNFGPNTFALLAIFVVLALACGMKQRSGQACAAWTFGGTCLFFNAMIQVSKLSEIYAPPYPLDILFAAGFPVLCAIGALRTAYATSRRKEDTGRWMMGGTGLALLIWGLPMLLPTLIHPREASSRTQCKNNLKQIGLAMHNYHDVYRAFPLEHPGKPPKSWRLTLLAYLEQPDLLEKYDEYKTWDSEQNEPISHHLISTYNCPSRPEHSRRNVAGQFLTSYVVPIGKHTLFDGSGLVGYSKVNDGTSNTIAAVEACGAKIVWTDPRDFDSVNGDVGVNSPHNVRDRSDSLLSSYHNGGAQILLADGSVRFMSGKVDPKVLQALLTKNAGDDPGTEW